ncbi:Peptidoglycan/LPS O-acetylase OafA/YrhL, contains acyltransferase and SGNH-hydrolase domains [Polynucleobacter meluiroseus]|uniref:Peptidoglycan/LPS O-acetylase OafA/YrhL, contains acyltransferase and SGNH-hydrolase domains n=1 Tax=Polynucleobacter meluiroseus TaxID=1938814 RepID=A0A240E0Y0_9BURK|nr:acyltransferase family protein [Polynucleobacter meluiroseus]SNX29095.1 Peptidoglycan/LPS O-acetylase OafA/YrhL, contains acyltransferase and SGNH-hydrolase domains [Polynucleobacter meluiroseus]
MTAVAIDDKKLAYRPDIDGLRAIAVSLVVIFHAFPDFLTGGFIGVDVFFVISGYLISRILFQEYAQEKFSITRFYIHRINRIFPALIVVMLSCYAFGWFNLLADEFKLLGKHISSGAGFISNWVLWNESGYFDRSSDAKPLLHLWSLGIEEQFYLIWPFLVGLCLRWKISVLKTAIAIALLTFAINIFIVFTNSNPAAAFYLPQARFWELMIGAILAYFAHNKQLESMSLRKCDWLSIVGLSLIIICAIVISRFNAFPGFWALMPALGSAALIAAGPNALCNRLILKQKVLVWIGLISYPLYLWHWPLLSFEYILHGEAESILIRLITVALSVALAACTYYLIERPIRFGAHKGVKSIILLILMIFIGYQGFNTYHRDGYVFRLKHLQFRLPPELLALSINPEKPAEPIAIAKSKAIETNRPAIFLWGDSYAGHLVAGYKEQFGQKFEIVELGSGCPALFNTELSNRKNCPQWAEINFARVLKERPAQLILAANWTDYPNWMDVSKTISLLQENGYTKITLVGPAPQWKDTLYKQLYLHYAFNRSQEGDNYQVPYRMKFGLKQNFFQIEPEMRQLAQKLGVHYLSIVDILCNPEGCITRFGDTADKLSSFDGGHLTTYTSNYVVERFNPK